MHDSIARELRGFRVDSIMRVADLGSYNINGSVRDVLPSVVGFDILPGPGVDVTITPGVIPPYWQAHFDLVTCCGVLMQAPAAPVKRELVDLLRNGGTLFLSMCWPDCYKRHTMPTGTFQNMTKFTCDELSAFLAPELTMQRCEEIEDDDSGHKSIVYVGVRE